MYKHIMLPVDGSDLSMKALPQALGLAKALHAKITLITAVMPYHTGITGPLTAEIVHEVEHIRDEAAKQPAEKLHQELLARARAEGIECDSVVELSDNPYVAIIETAEAKGCDVIVMASHGRRGLDAVLIGSETVKVLTHSKIPVLVLR